MFTLGVVGAYLATSVGAFFLLIDAWRRDFDLTRSDAFFLAFLSLLGPISFVAATVVWCISKLGGKESPVVWKRK
ncbi:hypothetical protein [Devosia elaeis]|nr:hypothetical protein [Devosia elaeis]